MESSNDREPDSSTDYSIWTSSKNVPLDKSRYVEKMKLFSTQQRQIEVIDNFKINLLKNQACQQCNNFYSSLGQMLTRDIQKHRSCIHYSSDMSFECNKTSSDSSSNIQNKTDLRNFCSFSNEMTISLTSTTSQQKFIKCPKCTVLFSSFEPLQQHCLNLHPQYKLQFSLKLFPVVESSDLTDKDMNDGEACIDDDQESNVLFDSPSGSPKSEKSHSLEIFHEDKSSELTDKDMNDGEDFIDDDQESNILFDSPSGSPKSEKSHSLEIFHEVKSSELTDKLMNNVQTVIEDDQMNNKSLNSPSGLPKSKKSHQLIKKQFNTLDKRITQKLAIYNDTEIMQCILDVDTDAIIQSLLYKTSNQDKSESPIKNRRQHKSSNNVKYTIQKNKADLSSSVILVSNFKDVKIPKKKSLDKKLIKSSSKELLKCFVCNKRDFVDIVSLKGHFDKNHPEVKVRFSTDEPEPYSFPCARCDSIFTNVLQLTNHFVTLHSSNLIFMCTLCKKWFEELPTLKEHYFEHTNKRPCKQCYTRHESSTAILFCEHNRKRQLKPQNKFECVIKHLKNISNE